MSRTRARDDARAVDVALASRARLRAGLYNASNTCYLNAILQARPRARSLAARWRSRGRSATTATTTTTTRDASDD
jgi:ubiquitin C-terminal hydrolase